MNLECLDDLNYIMIQGDTTSVLALSLAAFHRKIKVIHLEAGLRTYDFENPYPEEMNRQLVSRLANIHLCPTELDKDHLFNERVEGEIHVVGNTVLDNLIHLTPSYNDEVLITMHRRENHQIIPEWFDEFESLANTNPNLSFILLSHPNPNVQSHLHRLKKVQVISPLPHKELIQKLKDCRFIITDSGGLQEESCFLNKKSIVCRHKTERTAGVGIWSTLCPEPSTLKSIFNKIKVDYKPLSGLTCPYGDGKSSQKIYNILHNML
jgi:UDP-N-acetylglucosamine 2-epimerase